MGQALSSEIFPLVEWEKSWKVNVKIAKTTHLKKIFIKCFIGST